MNLDSSLEQMFQTQMSREYANALAYDNLAGGLEAEAWDGFAKFMRKSAEEERGHYRKFNDFLVDRNCTPAIQNAITSSVVTQDPLSAFTQAKGLEMSNTTLLIDLDRACANVGDQEARNFLIWALEEQRNSERELTDILIWLSRAQGNDAAMRDLDEKLGG